MSDYNVFSFCILTAVPVPMPDLLPPEVPDSAKLYMPSVMDDFGAGLMEVIQDVIKLLRPDLREAGQVCIGILAAIILISLVRIISTDRRTVCDFVMASVISCLLLESTGSMIRLGTQTTYEIGEYGKLFLPVMTTALAAQGGVTSSAALYSGTMVFNTLLTSFIARILNPMIHLYLACSVASAALEEDMLKRIQEIMKWVMTWCLKIILYSFTGYIAITGVVSGTTDAAALKVAKMTISGLVPVVGGILSDASEAVLVGAGTVKNAAGIYGMFAVLAIVLAPFVKISAHYLLLKATAALCQVFGDKKASALIGDYAAALGFLLAMTGAGCMIQIISITCFLKGLV